MIFQKPKDSGKESKKTEKFPSKVDIKSKTDWGGIIFLIILNVLSYVAIIHHFRDALDQIQTDADQLEKNTVFILGHWGDKHVKTADESLY